jgi:hypothetical protein
MVARGICKLSDFTAGGTDGGQTALGGAHAEARLRLRLRLAAAEGATGGAKAG